MDAYQVAILAIGSLNVVGAFILFPMSKRIDSNTTKLNQVDKEVLKLRVHMSDHYVTKPDLEKDLIKIINSMKELSDDYKSLRESSHTTNNLLNQLVNKAYYDKAQAE